MFDEKGDLARQKKALHEPIYLIESIPPEDESEMERKYVVMGSTGNVYNVNITYEPTCSCPDYRMRQNRCKHIYFILKRVMKCSNQSEIMYTYEELEEMFKKIPKITHNLIAKKDVRDKYLLMKEEKEEQQYLKKIKKNTKKNVDEEALVEQKPIEGNICPICLEELDNGEELDYCKLSCGNSIHCQCFKMWVKKYTPLCVFCKERWLYTSNEKNDKKKGKGQKDNKANNEERKNKYERRRAKSYKKKNRSRSRGDSKFKYVNLLDK